MCTALGNARLSLQPTREKAWHVHRKSARVARDWLIGEQRQRRLGRWSSFTVQPIERDRPVSETQNMRVQRQAVCSQLVREISMGMRWNWNQLVIGLVLCGACSTGGERRTDSDGPVATCDTDADCEDFGGKSECIQRRCRNTEDAGVSDAQSSMADVIAKHPQPDADAVPEPDARSPDETTAPRFDAVEPSNCEPAGPRYCCCGGGSLEDGVCTAQGVWRCDGSWPLDSDLCEPDSCTSDYEASWTDFGADLPWCEGATSSTERSLPWEKDIEWTVEEDGSPLTPSDLPTDVVASGTWVDAGPADGSGAQERLRVTLEFDGVTTNVLLTLPEDTEFGVQSGTEITARVKYGMLSVELADSKTLVFAVSGDGTTEEPDRQWVAGPFTLSSGDGVCIVEVSDCNWRDVVTRLHIEWGEGEESVRPGEEAVLEVDGRRYAVDAVSLVHPTTAFEGATCGSLRYNQDSFRIRLLPE